MLQNIWTVIRGGVSLHYQRKQKRIKMQVTNTIHNLRDIQALTADELALVQWAPEQFTTGGIEALKRYDHLAYLPEVVDGYVYLRVYGTDMAAAGSLYLPFRYRVERVGRLTVAYYQTIL